MSSYLAFRYIEDKEKEFMEGLHHENFTPVPESERISVTNAKEIFDAIGEQIKAWKGKKPGILLSGGMDSANLAPYYIGCDAYTFRFLEGKFQKEELERAQAYAKYYKLNLHYVDIDWTTVEKYLIPVMKAKGAPVHSIEPQLLQAALQAKEDGIEYLVIGESADLIFGGMDQLISKDWDFDAFMNRYIFTNPEKVLKNPVSMQYLFERYRQGEKIDFLKFMDDIFSVESSGSYQNAFNVAGMPYLDPYAKLIMKEPLNLQRVRNGEPKYLIRELFAMNYPKLQIPDKNPMPRPVDAYFIDWEGPLRPEFQDNLDMKQFSGNQKWQMYCLEQFLNMIDAQK